MSARSYLLMALIVISSISQSHATTIGFTDVSVLIFSPRESMLQAGHNSQLSRATHTIHSKCASKLLPVVVLTGIIPDENAPFETELARSRVANVKHELQILGLPEKAIYDAIYTESEYRENWRLAPERAQASVHSVEVELVCHAK